MAQKTITKLFYIDLSYRGASYFSQYLAEPGIENMLELTQVIHENTAHEILALLANRKNLIKHGHTVFKNAAKKPTGIMRGYSLPGHGKSFSLQDMDGLERFNFKLEPALLSLTDSEIQFITY